MKLKNAHLDFPFPFLGLIAVLLLGYFPLLFDPSLHTACPENDSWNLPIRWSVITALRDGHLPLWNPLSAFGIPWLATWQTETFYPGTWIFKEIGLGFWNLSGLTHLFIFSAGIFYFVKKQGGTTVWAFGAATLGLLNGCAFNHLGSNSSMDTMAWIPWMFWAVHVLVEKRRLSFLPFSLFLVLQVFAGYPQIILYTLIGCFAYGLFHKGSRALPGILIGILLGLLFSCAQWIPSFEYFVTQAARLPAVHDNPNFFLPPENLKTLLDPFALARDGKPDYVANPTFFYFNLYSGLLPLFILGAGIVFLKKLCPSARFFLFGTLAVLLWALGFPGIFFVSFHLPFPSFLEPAKSWVLLNFFFLVSFAVVSTDLFKNDKKWSRPFLGLCVLNLLVFVHLQPLERNLLPGDPVLTAAAKPLQDNLGTGRALILPNLEQHAKLYTPLPDPDQRPLFKHFIPNSNYFVGLPLATFYGSTQPSWGALDAGFYFQHVFPETSGALMDLLGVDLLYIPQDHLPPHYQKLKTDDGWTLWKNPHSLGGHFFFSGPTSQGDRKVIFTQFASGHLDPRQVLFLDPSNERIQDLPIPQNVQKILLEDGHVPCHLIVTQNDTPGWHAWVDRKEMDISLADGIFQAIPVPAAAKEVSLAYEPAAFRFGLFLSLIGLVGFGCLGSLRIFNKTQLLPRRSRGTGR